MIYHCADLAKVIGLKTIITVYTFHCQKVHERCVLILATTYYVFFLRLNSFKKVFYLSPEFKKFNL